MTEPTNILYPNSSTIIAEPTKDKAILFVISVAMFTLSFVSVPWIFGTKSVFFVVQVLISVLALLFLLTRNKIRLPRYDDPLVASLLIFYLISALSAWNNGSDLSWQALQQITKFYIYSLIMSVYLLNRASNIDINFLFIVFGISTSMCSITAITDFIGVTRFYRFSYFESMRSGGILGSPTNSAMILSLAFSLNYFQIKRLLMARSHKQKRFLSLLMIILTIFITGGVFVSGSRAGLIVFIFLVAGIVLKERKKAIIIATAIIFLCLVVTIFVSIKYFGEKSKNVAFIRYYSMFYFVANPTETELTGGSIATRVYATFDTIQRALANPWLGIGPGVIKEEMVRNPLNLRLYVYAKSMAFDKTSHNTYLNNFAEAGIPAGFVFIIIIIVLTKSFYNAWKNTHGDEYYVLFLCFLAYLIFLMSQVILYRNNLLFNMFIPLAVNIRYGHHLRKS